MSKKHKTYTTEFKAEAIKSIKISIYAVRQIKSLNQLYCKRHKRLKRNGRGL